MRSFLFSCVVCLVSCSFLLTPVASAYSDDDSQPPSMPSYGAQATSPEPAADGSALVFEFGKGQKAHEPVVLTGKNFFDLVLDSRGPWMVAFVAPWCGHCQALKEPWAKTSRELVSTVRLGLIDATVEKSLAAQFKISAFPTILAFPPGKKTPKNINTYSGPRGVNELVMFAKGMLNLRLIKRISSTHKQYPENILSFFGGIPRNGYIASTIPTFLVFLHTPKPSLEIQSISQTFENRLNVAVIEKEDAELRRIFRVRNNPAYVACKPGRATRVNETGIIECSTYDHTAKGAGQSVPSLTDFLVKFVSAAGAATPAAHDSVDSKKNKIVFRRFTVDKSKADAAVTNANSDAHAAGSHSSATGSSAPLAPSSAPIQPTSVTQFHQSCTDLLQGICLLMLVDSSAKETLSSVQGLMRHIDSWNSAHSEKKSVKVVQLQSGSPLVNGLVEHLNVVLDSTSPMNLIALFPHRNRLVSYRSISSSSFDLDDALDWLERVAGDDAKVKLQKVQNLPKLLRKKVQEGHFAKPAANSTPAAADSKAYDEL